MTIGGSDYYRLPYYCTEDIAWIGLTSEHYGNKMEMLEAVGSAASSEIIPRAKRLQRLGRDHRVNLKYGCKGDGRKVAV